MLAFVNFVRIAFLPGFLQIALTFSDLSRCLAILLMILSLLSLQFSRT